MRILFVAALHHPEVLQAAIAATPPGQKPPLFPTSAAQHFWEKALTKRGHVVDVFYGNLPAWAVNSNRSATPTTGHPHGS